MNFLRVVEVLETFQDCLEHTCDFNLCQGTSRAFINITDASSVAVLEHEPQVISLEVASEVAYDMRALALLQNGDLLLQALDVAGNRHDLDGDDVTRHLVVGLVDLTIVTLTQQL